MRLKNSLQEDKKHKDLLQMLTIIPPISYFCQIILKQFIHYPCNVTKQKLICDYMSL